MIHNIDNVVGIINHNTNTSPTNVNNTSHDCVASTEARDFISFLTRSVALKNNNVAIIHELTATIKL